MITSLSSFFHDLEDVAVIFDTKWPKKPLYIEAISLICHLVVKFACLVVKKEHLVVILNDLVVKITGLVVIVELWNSKRGVSLKRKGYWWQPRAVIWFLIMMFCSESFDVTSLSFIAQWHYPRSLVKGIKCRIFLIYI